MILIFLRLTGNESGPPRRIVPSFLLALKDFGLNQAVMAPTRKANILDLICVPPTMCAKELEIIASPAQSNDHAGLSVSIRLSKQKTNIISREKRDIDQDKIPLFRELLHNTYWECFLLGERL